MLGKNSGPAFSLFARVAAAGCQGVFLVLLARSASLAEFGIYSTICAAGAIVIGLIGLGLPIRALQIRADQGDLGGSYLGAAAILSATSCLVCLVISTAIAGHISWIGFAASCFTAAELQNNIAQSYLYGMKRNRDADVFTMFRRLLPLGALVVGFSYSDKSLIFPLVSLSFIVAWLWGVLRFAGRYNFSNIRKNVLRGGSDYWLINVWAMLQQLDVILINTFFGSYLSGLYASAVRLASPVHIITSVVTSRLVPSLTHAPDLTARSIAWRRVYVPLRALLVLALICSPVLFWLAPLIFGLPSSVLNLMYVAAFGAAILSLYSQVVSSALYTQGMASVVQRYTKIAVLFGLSLVAVGGYFENYAVAGTGILCSQLVLSLLLLKAKNEVEHAK